MARMKSTKSAKTTKTKKKTTTRKPRVKKTIEPTPTQQIVEPQNQIVYLRDDQMVEEIRCSLMKVPKYAGMVPSDEQPRLGSYLGSKRNPHKVRGTTYNVAFSIVVDWQEYRNQRYSDVEIVKRCLTYIFTKKMKKKVKKGFEEVLPFGNVHLNPIFYSFLEKNGKKYISVETTTDQKENPLLWGEGVK